jgi:hypothetical protein
MFRERGYLAFSASERGRMLTENLMLTIASAGAGDLDCTIVPGIYKAWDNGTITEDDAMALQEAVDARRAEFRPKPQMAPLKAPAAAIRKPRRYRTNWDRIERGRVLQKPKHLPPELAKKFTGAETAILGVIVDQVRLHGRCNLTTKQIGDIAGKSRRMVQITCHKAALRCLIRIDRQRLSPRRSKSNVIEIIQHDWRCWLGLDDKGAPKEETRPSTTSRRRTPFHPLLSEGRKKEARKWHSRDDTGPAYRSHDHLKTGTAYFEAVRAPGTETWDVANPSHTPRNAGDVARALAAEMRRLENEVKAGRLDKEAANDLLHDYVYRPRSPTFGAPA